MDEATVLMDRVAREHGAIFWPDYGAGRPALPTGVLSRSHPIWELTGVPYRGDREFRPAQRQVRESGEAPACERNTREDGEIDESDDHGSP